MSYPLGYTSRTLKPEWGWKPGTRSAVFKVGSTTGTEVYVYECGTAAPADPRYAEHAVDRTTQQLIFLKTKADVPFCKSGDSGGQNG
jgi:hypothetical protein